MQISPISFGKVVKVQAPANVVEELADIANSKQMTPIATELKEIFSDRLIGPVQRYSIDENNSYLLSGKDSENMNQAYTSKILPKDYHDFMGNYVKNHCEDTITVAHDGEFPKAICLIA